MNGRAVARRRALLVDLVRGEARTFAQLCQLLPVSEATLRKDLALLERAGKLTRVPRAFPLKWMASDGR